MTIKAFKRSDGLMLPVMRQYLDYQDSTVMMVWFGSDFLVFICMLDKITIIDTTGCPAIIETKGRISHILTLDNTRTVNIRHRSSIHTEKKI